MVVPATPHASPGARGARLVTGTVLLSIVAWALLVWSGFRPAEIVSDWNGWRQTDTQTIALKLTEPGASILRPEIRWGGDGPGYVEAEFQLYTRIVAWLMMVVGKAEWVGQFVSTLAIALTAVVIFVHVSRRYRGLAAAVGVVAFLAGRISPFLATVVMPDALALLAYVVAWTCFYRYATEGRTRDLVAFGVVGALAMLTKPTTAHIGISSFLFLVLAAPARLKEYRIWVTWVLMVAAVAAYLVYANHLYTTYGNTFGLLAGEDKKTPGLEHLMMPRIYMGVLRNAIGWGLGQVAALVFIVLLLRRRLEAEHLALAVGNAVIVFVAMRYMSQDAGNYYFAPVSLLAACGVAAFTDDLLGQSARPQAWRVAAVTALVALLAVQGYRNLNLRYVYGHFNDPDVMRVVSTGRELGKLTKPEDLVVVRSVNEAYDVFWKSGRNYHEPRIFYMTNTRGWTIGREQGDVALLANATQKGARFFVDPLQTGHPEIDAWLQRSAELVWTEPDGGRIWRLRSASRP